LLRSISQVWPLLAVMLLLGCRTIGSDPWRAAQIEPGPERAAARDFAPASARTSAPDGLFAFTDPGELPQLFVAGEGQPSTLPLKHTDVDARVLGHVAQVRVTQSFHNDRPRPIEVVYTFPLPENAARRHEDDHRRAHDSKRVPDGGRAALCPARRLGAGRGAHQSADPRPRSTDTTYR